MLDVAAAEAGTGFLLTPFDVDVDGPGRGWLWLCEAGSPNRRFILPYGFGAGHGVSLDGAA